MQGTPSSQSLASDPRLTTLLYHKTQQNPPNMAKVTFFEQDERLIQQVQ